MVIILYDYFYIVAIIGKNMRLDYQHY